MVGKQSVNSTAGWAAGPNGTRLWGKRGAAGLLLMAPNQHGELTVLMQHRAQWTSQGDTWALPGGAMELGEDAIAAAIREAAEETGIEMHHYQVLDSLLTAGPFPADPRRPELPGGWTYTTVIALASQQLLPQANEESYELRWVPLEHITDLELMPAFAESWPGLLKHLEQLL